MELELVNGLVSLAAAVLTLTAVSIGLFKKSHWFAILAKDTSGAANG
jgi:hypothetical protein